MDILTLSPKSTFAIHYFQKNNCYRNTTLLFGLGQTIIYILKQYLKQRKKLVHDYCSLIGLWTGHINYVT